MNLSVFIFLLSQALAGYCLTCTTIKGHIGICTPEKICMGQTPRTMSTCNSNGLYCCPLENDLDWRLIEEQYQQYEQPEEPKFPTDCGVTPVYPYDQIVGGFKIAPDEFSWIASLMYENTTRFGVCGGSVINSLYVLTAAHCVDEASVKRIGTLTGVRLGDFERGNKCDYGTANCTNYQLFGIDRVIVHRGFRQLRKGATNDIALVRLDRRIQFGSKMKPVCLPFGDNNIPEPTAESLLTISGWGITADETEVAAKRSVTVSVWDTERCKETFDVDETHICAVLPGKNSCNGDSGGPLMNMFKRARMVIEGIVSFGIRDCTLTDLPGVYTRVRSYGDWLDKNMEM
ncbi:hypothetical protein KR222_003691 [Zaprionus bogoriensis]|nr:hypothetical protein KR222_003691 [Zaprionus bogoriensis]